MDSKGTNEEIRAADEEVTAAAAEIVRCEVRRYSQTFHHLRGIKFAIFIIFYTYWNGL